MASIKPPKKVDDVLRPKFGSMASILAQSPAVADSFGRWPGFALMVLAMMVMLIIGLAGVAALAKGISIVVPHYSLSVSSLFWV
ncbi:hypothetical protein [Bradyrhizobium sp. dw_411]|uniref:hypothetical protein n=1 Tax=Bradyrhizobium sp. dw_411 TaxID=2720082 RepID=UPI001BD019C1|nr:hypothetical protein [Bradyrhizobium sp. dw_411]